MCSTRENMKILNSMIFTMLKANILFISFVFILDFLG